MTLLGRWWFALKPKSWPKLLVPCVLGQALGVATVGTVSISGLGLGVAFTVCDLVFIVLMNDFGDREVDAIKRRMFPRGCSPKTIPDGILPATAVLGAGLLAGLAAALIATIGGLMWDRPWLGPAAIVCLCIFVAYTLPPLRLNYRGGGELLEMFGVGVALPWINAYAQSGHVAIAHGGWVLTGFGLLSLSSALASGLSDERSDRRGGKRTFATALGNRITRRAVEVSMFGGAAVWLLAAGAGVAVWLTLPPVVVVGIYLASVRRRSAAAVTDAFTAQAHYKRALHAGIWRSALVLSGLLVVSGM